LPLFVGDRAEADINVLAGGAAKGVPESSGRIDETYGKTGKCAEWRMLSVERFFDHRGIQLITLWAGRFDIWGEEDFDQEK